MRHAPRTQQEGVRAQIPSRIASLVITPVMRHAHLAAKQARFFLRLELRAAREDAADGDAGVLEGRVVRKPC